MFYPDSCDINEKQLIFNLENVDGDTVTTKSCGKKVVRINLCFFDVFVNKTKFI